jgi:hypothetical protein
LVEDDCQENAGCFADEEATIDPSTDEILTLCHCFLGFVLDNSTADFPKTGTCINLRTAECDKSSEVNCYEDEDFWGVCPYCRAFKHHEDHGGELDLGSYVEGEGVFDSDPMVFEGGSDANCNGVQRTSEAYWYCWYYAFDDIVSLDHVYTLWLEDPLCHYLAYIYTPLACDWALP